MKLAAALVLAVLASPVFAQTVLVPGTMMEWEGGPQVYVYGDLEAGLAIEDGPDGSREAVLTVRAPGMAPVRIGEGTAGPGWGEIGVFFMAGTDVPTLLSGVHSGGAHCCLQLTAVTPVGGRLVAMPVGAFDTTFVEPVDIDGDGRMELVLPDDRFNYVFDGYAGSVPARLVYVVGEDGEIVDATAEPRFAGVQQRTLADSLGACSGDIRSYSACAAVLAAAARLGDFDRWFGTIDLAFRSGAALGTGWETFSICADDACDETTDFDSFSEAIVAALKAWGYLNAGWTPSRH